MNFQIRRITRDDIPEIMDIYNNAITNTTATLDAEPKTRDYYYRWMENRRDYHPIIVACVNGVTVGYASLNQWSDRQAYNTTAEISVYIREAFHGMGIGKELMRQVLEIGKKEGLHAVLSRITQGNDISIKIHKNAGFFDVGVLKEVGFKFGRYLDVHVLQLIFKD